MKSKIGLRILNLMVATLLVLGNVMMGSTPVLAQTGTATASATPSDSAPTVGDQITVVVNIDLSSVASPDNALGSYTGTLDWDPAILDYQSYSSAPPSGFTGVVNTSGVDSGEITFNGANTSGATGNTIVISITFDVVGEGTSALDLGFSAMAAAVTFNSLLSVLTVNDSSVTASAEAPVTLSLDGAVSSGTGAANATSASFSHTTGTGTDRLMLVGVSWNSNTTSRTISSVTFSYGAGPTVLNLSEKIVQETGSTTKRFTAIWYSPTEPPQNTTGTITVTFSGTVSNGIVAGAANFAGVDQTTPLGAAVGANSSSTGTTLSVTLDSLAGDELIFDTAFVGASTPPDPTVGADQTSLWSATVSNTRGVASIEQATSSSVTMSWTTGSTAVVWAIAAVPINPSGPDITDPTVTIEQATAQSDPTYDSPVNFTVEFNESVDDFVTGDVTLSGTAGATTAAVTGSGKTYNVAVSGMTSSGTIIASIAAGVAHDAAGNPNEASTSSDNEVTYILDNTGPSVTINQAGAQADPTSDSPINFTVVFNETVDDFATGDVTLGGTAGATTAEVTGSGTTYNVAVSGMSTSGTVTASIAASVAHDAAGNPNEASTSTDNTVTFEYIPSGNVELDGDFSSNTADDVSSINITHTTGTGTNRLMLVGIAWNCGTAGRTISSVTFTPDGGSALALSAVITQQAGTQLRYSAIYSLLAPPSAVSGTVTVTFSGSVSNGIMAGVANFAGVDGTTPLGTPNGAGSDVNDTDPTVTLTGLTGDELVFANVFQGASATTQELTVGPDQTQLWYPAYIANIRAAASIEQAAGDTVTMSWTAVTASYWANAAVPINPAPLTPTCYALTLSHSGSGTTPTATPANSTGCSAGQYVASEAITLSGAVPATGWAISGWSGTSNNASTANTNTLTMPASAHAASVIYTQQEYTLTANAVGSGSVTKDPNQATYHYNDVVELEATAASGWEFSAWSGALTGTTNPASITITGNMTVTATFTEIAPTCYALTLSHSGSGTTPTATPANSTGCSAGQYVASEAITLSGAVPATGWAISGWSGTSNNASTAATNTLAMPASAHAASVIYEQQEYTLTTNAVGSGSVAKDPNQATYHYNDVVELEATAASGWEFSAWSGALTGTTNPTSITITGNMTVTATFTEIVPTCYALTLSHSGSGTTPTATPANSTGCSAGQYVASEAITLSGAVPATGWAISGWSGTANDASTGATNTLAMPASAHTASVNYAQQEYTLTANVVGSGSVAKDPNQATYHYNDVVILDAIAASGWEFSAWSGALTGTTNPASITITGNMTVTATFTETTPPDSAVSSVTPSDTTPAVNDQITVVVNIDVSDVNAPNDALGSYTGTLDWDPAILEYQSYSGAPPTGFTGAINTADVGTGHLAFNGAKATGATGNTIVINITFKVIGAGTSALDLAYSAMAAATTFTNLLPVLTINDSQVVVPAPIEYTLTLNHTGNGSVSANPSPPYYENDIVELTATADAGWSFTNWSGNLSGSDNPETITMNSNKTVTANFTQNEYTLTVNTDGSGSVNVDPVKTTYHYGDVVTLTAVPDTDWVLSGWSGNLSGTINPASLTITGNMSVTAHFIADTPGTIAHIADIGSASNKTTGTSLVITTTSAVIAGDDIIVAFATYGDPDYAISITDSAGNTYEEVAQSICYQHGRTYIFAAYDVTALPSGSSITITHTSVAARAAVASVFRGLAKIDPLDQSLGNPAVGAEETASGTTATVGPTGTTAQPSELLIGAIGTEGPLGDTAGTWGNSFIAGLRTGTTGGDADSNWTISLGYRIVSSTGTYTAQKSGMTDRYWAAAIATFKADSGIPVLPDFTLLLSRPTDTSINTNAILEQGGQIYYKYGTTPGSYPGQTGTLAATAGEPVEIAMTGLLPDTQYYYRMVYSDDGDEWVDSEEYTFHTQRAQDEAFTFTIASDTHLGDTFSGNDPDRYEQATLNIAADNPDFHIDLGDAFVMSGPENQAEANAVYLAQRPYFDNFGRSAPIFLTIGNHENEEGWNLDDTPFSKALGSIIARKMYYPNPIPDGFYTGNTDLLPAVGGDQYREDYYAWEWGDVLFVVLDPFQYTMVKPYGNITGSGEDNDETVSGDQWNWTLGQQQYDWFKQTLEDSDAKFKFVFAHHIVGGQLNVSGSAGLPGYVRGGGLASDYFEWGGLNADDTWGFETKRPGWGNDPIHTLMLDNGVNAFFHGHDHQFVHEVVDGIVYQLVPSPAMTGYGFDLYDSSPYVVSGGNLPNAGHVRVTVDGDEATVEYVRSAISGDTGVVNGSVSYSYTIEATTPTHDLTISIDPSGSGTTNPSAGTHTYTEGTLVTITPTPASGYAFDHWSGACTGSGACQVTMDANKSVVAYFTELPPTCHALTLSHTGQGANPVASPTNSTGCTSGSYLAGEIINLSGASADTGWHISGWSGTANDASTAATNTLTMPDAAHAASVAYTQDEYTLSINLVGSGSVSKDPSKTTYHYGDTVILTGIAATGWQFSAWSGDLTGTDNPDTLTIVGNMTVTATFTQIMHNLTISVDPLATGTTNPAAGVHSYSYGTVVSIIPTPASGYLFDHWSGACTGSGACQVTMDAAKSVTAHFTELPPTCYALTLSHTGQGANPIAAPTNSSGCPAGSYIEGENISLSGAAADTGWHISGWSGTANNASTASTNSLSMPDAAHTASVIYAENPVVSTWYLAEGYTGSGFGTYILIQNPNDEPTQVDITYMLSDGSLINRDIIVDANSRYTVVAQDASQVGADQAFSTKLEADLPIIVERAMYWPNGDGTTGGHDTAGIRQPETTWYLAEGFTGSGFETFILLQNPNSSAANVQVTYMIQGGSTLTRNVTVPANSRYTILTNETAQVGADKAFSTKLVADLPIIVERAMYFSNEGHATSGIAASTNTWYLAEGYTGADFGTYILVQNPNGAATQVEITYMLSDGSLVNKEISVPANSRYTIVAQETDQVGVDKTFSTKLVADLPIIVERAMYWPNGDGTIGGHNTAGVRQAETIWYLAEGYTGAGFETFILLQNPNSTATDVEVTYMIQGGGTITRSVTIPANSRFTILANETAQVGADKAFSTKLEADLPIIVERALYFSNGGHVAEGVILTP